MNKDILVSSLTSNLDQLTLSPEKSPVKTVGQELLSSVSSGRISIEEFEALIRKFLDKVEKLQSGHNSVEIKQLADQFKVIKSYLNDPMKIKDATKMGGVRAVYKRYETAMLRACLKLSSSSLNLSETEANLVTRVFDDRVKQRKVKLAYSKLATGVKYKKLGSVKLSPIKGPNNPMAELSKANIARLKTALKTNDKNPYGLRSDELELMRLLMQLPLFCQHATNFFYPIANAGSLDSYTEIQRQRPEFESPFSTKGNVKKLGNGGFVFFRVFVEGVNGSESRYGNTRLITDITLLENCGWISLHDQLIPFPHKGSSKKFTCGGRILRIGGPANIKSNTKTKADRDGIEYSYRRKALPEKNPFKGKDTLKSFLDKDTPKKSRTFNFTEEIFYGKDILLGIALSVIYELRWLEECGFRKEFLKTLYSKKDPLQQINLLGQLVKGLFRIEGKYPVSLRLLIGQEDGKARFFPYLKQKEYEGVRAVEVDNPAGDNRYNWDLTINDHDMRCGLLMQEFKFLMDKLDVCKKLRGRFEGTSNYDAINDQVIKYEARQKAVSKELDGLREESDLYVDYFQTTYGVDIEILKQMSLTKLILIHSYFDELMQNDLASFDDFVSMPINTLTALTHELFVELLTEEQVTLDELINLSPAEIQVFSDCDNFMRIFTEHNMIFSDFIKLYREDPEHLTYLTTDDLTDLMMEEAPDISPLLEEYARNNDVDFDYVRSQLGESDQILWDIRFGVYQDSEEIDDFEEDMGSNLSLG